jgi:hypothetical protein
MDMETTHEDLLNRQYKDVYELWEDLAGMPPDHLLQVATQRFGLYPEGRNVADLEVRLLEQYEVMRDILNAYKLEQGMDTPNNEDQVALTADVADATASQEMLPAIAIAERETAKLPEGTTKQHLQAIYQNWRQQIQQGFGQGRNWLENWRNQRIARAALDLFNRGYNRTGERSYQMGEYVVTARGRNLYVLKDSKGELMRFQTSRSALMGMRVQVLGVSDRLPGFHEKTIQSIQQNRTITPQGDADIEANYAARTSRVEQTVLQFLQTKVRAKVWDKDGGQFRLEIGEGGLLRITDKQGDRGVVFQRQNGAVFSKLNAQDFAHFDRLAAKMQQSQSRVRQARTPTPHRSGLELA